MDNIKLLREQRAEIVRELNKLAEEVQRDDRSFTDDERNQFDKLETEQSTLQNKIETIERTERTKALQLPDNKNSVNYRPNAISEKDKDLAFRSWALYQGGFGSKLTDRHREAVNKTGVDLGSSTYTFRAQTVGTAGEGGNLLNGSLFQGLEQQLKYYSGVRANATIVKTTDGNPIHWAFTNNTSRLAAIVGENTTTSNTAITYSKISIGSFTYRSAVYPLSIELAQDASFDIGSHIGEVLAESVGRKLNADYTSGAGTTLPFGVLTDCTSAATTAATTDVTFNELIDLYHSVDIAYRDKAKWMMNDATVAALRKKVDDNSRPLFLDMNQGYANGGGLTLLGKEIIVNNSCPSLTAAAKGAVSFGDFSKYVIRDVSEIQVKVLNELYMLDGSIAFVVFYRGDAKLTNTVAVKCLTQHA